MATAESVNELREDVPLKLTERRSRLCVCNEDCMGGSRFINVSFGALTVIITVALLVQIYYGDYQVAPHGSVATDNLKCSEIGTYILKKGGNSADAAIASAFCMAVVAPHITGLDAEGDVMVYNHKTRINPTVISFKGNRNTSNQLPKLVLGLADVHRLYGSLPWKFLVAPAADLARYGFPVSKPLAVAIEKFGVQTIYGHLQVGEVLQLSSLAHTLDVIADTPVEEFYKNETSEIHSTFKDAIKTTFHNYNVFTPNHPTMGPLFSLILQYMEHNNISHLAKTAEQIYYIPHIIQTVYEEFNVSENFHEGGTFTNIAVMDLEDNYVSLTMGLSAPFGSKEMTEFGFMLDGQKYAPCARLPLIVVDSKFICGKRMIFGAADPAEAAQVLFSLVVSAQNVTTGIEAPRFKQFFNATIGIEINHSPKFSDDVMHYLSGFGALIPVSEPYESCNIVAKRNDELSSHSDSRGGGIASRF